MMLDFKKITVPPVEEEQKNKEEVINERKNMRQNKSPKKALKILLIVLTIILLIGIGTFLAVYFPAKKTLQAASEAMLSAKEAYALVKKQDILGAGEKLKDTKQKLLVTQKDLRALSWTGIIPFAGNYYRDANHLINAGIYGVEAGDIVVDAVRPHADLLGLKGQGSFVGGTAEERIQKTVQTMDKITPKIDDVEHKLISIRNEIDQIDSNRYPEKIFGKKVNSNLTSAKKIIDELSLAIKDAKPLIVAIPKLLGEPTEKKYLILFQNDKELRSTGGFITAYAVFRMEHGKAYAEASEDIYKLDESRTVRVPAPEPILKYLPLVSYWNLRDSNISPDYVVSMKNFEDLYKSSTEKVNYDGIIAIDTHVLLKIMEVLGPIDIYGTQFTTEITPQCNCPQVIYELERYADQPVGYEKGNRKDLIGRLMYAIMQKSLSSSPKLYWGRLFQVGMDELNQKHILIYLKDENAQKGVEAVNFAGKIREYNGDYLHINDTNLAGAKSNMYVQENVSQKIEKQGDGSLTKTVVIKYNNPQPPSNCNLEKGELCLNGLLRNWLRVYVPKGSKLLESKGSEVKVISYEDMGKTVFEGFLTVRPQGTAQVTLKYQLPFKVDGSEIKILIQKQPGTVGNAYTLDAGGKLQEFNLTTDKEVKIKI